MSNDRTPRKGRRSPRKIGVSSTNESNNSRSLWDNISPFSTPRTGRVRPSSWDNSDEDLQGSPTESHPKYRGPDLLYINSENEFKEPKTRYPNYEENESEVYAALLEEMKIIELDRRQSPARVRRRSKSSGSSSPILDGKTENMSEKEGNISSEDSDIPSPEFNQYLDFNNIFSDLRFKPDRLEEEQAIENKKLNLGPITMSEIGGRYTKTFRRLSKILEVEELKRESDDKMQKSSHRLNGSINSFLKNSQDELPIEDEPRGKHTDAESDEKKLYLNKSLSDIRLDSKTSLPETKAGSISERCQLLGCNDTEEVIFLTAKTGKTEIGFTKESDWIDWSRHITSATVYPATTPKTNDLGIFKNSEAIKNLLKSKNSPPPNHSQLGTDSNPSINLSERTEEVVFLDSPKFEINLDSVRSLEVEDVRTPSTDKQKELRKLIKSNRTTRESSTTDSFRKNKNLQEERSKYSKQVPKSLREEVFKQGNQKQEEKIIDEHSFSENSSILSLHELCDKSRDGMFTWEQLAELRKFQAFQESTTARGFPLSEEPGSEIRETETEWENVENVDSKRSSNSTIEKYNFIQNNSNASTNRSTAARDAITPKENLSSRNPSPRDQNAVRKKNDSRKSSRDASSSKWKHIIEKQNLSTSGKSFKEHETGMDVSGRTENSSEDLKSFTQNDSSDSSSNDSISSEKVANDDSKASHRSNLSKKFKKNKKTVAQDEIINPPDTSAECKMNLSDPAQQGECISKTEKHDEALFFQRDKIKDMLLNQKAHKNTLPTFNNSEPSNVNDRRSTKSSPTNLKEEPRMYFQRPATYRQPLKSSDSSISEELKKNIYLTTDDSHDHQTERTIDRIDYNYSEKSSGRVTFDDIIRNFESKEHENSAEEEGDDVDETVLHNETYDRFPSVDFQIPENDWENKYPSEASGSSRGKFEGESESINAEDKKEVSSEKPTTGAWNDLIEAFNKDQKNPFENHFPGFPEESQLHENKTRASEAMRRAEETPRSPEPKKNSPSTRLQQTQENDSDSVSHLYSGFKSVNKMAEKRENYLECNSQTFFFDLEKKEPLVGEFGDTSFWNSGNLKQTDSEKPQDHGDGYPNFETYKESNLPAKKPKDTKTQRQLWTELKEKSFNNPGGSSFLLPDTNPPSTPQVFKKSVSEEYLEKMMQADECKTLSNPTGDGYFELKFLEKQIKFDAESNSELCLANAEPKEEGKSLETVRKLSCSAFTINTTGLENENSSEILKRESMFESWRNETETFLVKRDKNKTDAKTNNWLTVHSRRKKKMKKVSNSEPGKWLLLKSSPSDSERRIRRQTPPNIPLLRLRKTSCLRSFCKRVVSVFCLTSDSTPATSK